MALTRRMLLKYFAATSLIGTDVFNEAHAKSLLLGYSWRKGVSLDIPIQEIYPAVFGGEIFVGGGSKVGPQGTSASVLVFGA